MRTALNEVAVLVAFRRIMPAGRLEAGRGIAPPGLMNVEAVLARRQSGDFGGDKNAVRRLGQGRRADLLAVLIDKGCARRLGSLAE